MTKHFERWDDDTRVRHEASLEDIMRWDDDVRTRGEARKEDLRRNEVKRRLANRDLDRLISEKVMGRFPHCSRRHEGAHEGDCLWFEGTDMPGDAPELPYYSTSISDAWSVVGQMQSLQPSDLEGCSPEEGDIWKFSLAFDDEWHNRKMLRRKDIELRPEWAARMIGAAN